MNEILAQAIRLTASGLSVIPIKPDSCKAPAVYEWKPYQREIVNPNVLHFWFDNGKPGLAVVAGQVSGNLEALVRSSCQSGAA